MDYSQTHVKVSLLFTAACCFLLFSCEQDAVFNSDSEGQVLADNEEVLLLNSIEAQPIEVPEVAYSFFGENAAFRIEGEGQEVQGMFDVSALAERFPQHQGFQVIEFDEHWQQTCYQYVVPEFVENGSFSLPVRTGRNYVVYTDLGAQVNNTYNLFCQIRRIPTVTLEQVPEICTQILCAEQAIQDAQQLQEAMPSLAEHAGELSPGFPFGGLGGVEGAEGVCEGCTAPADNSFIPSVECYQTGPDCGRGACNLTVLTETNIWINDLTTAFEFTRDKEGNYIITNFLSETPKIDLWASIVFSQPVDTGSFGQVGYRREAIFFEGFGYSGVQDAMYFSCNQYQDDYDYYFNCWKFAWDQDLTKLRFTKLNLSLSPCSVSEGEDRCLMAEIVVRLKDQIRAQCGRYLDGDGDGVLGGDYLFKTKIYYKPEG